jgi:hypothetical protein
MRSLFAAHHSNANFARFASEAPKTSPLFRVFSAWAKMASAQEDQFLRLSYIEGALGYAPNSLTRKPSMHLAEARSAITEGNYESNPIANKLVVGLGMSPAEALKFVSANDQQIWSGLVYAASRQMLPAGSIRGISAHAVVNSLAFGLSPITGNWMKYGQGKGMMYWLGERAPQSVTLEGMKSIAKKEVANRTKDLVRGTAPEEKGMFSLDAPSEFGAVDSPAAMLESLTQGQGFSEDLASSILRYDSTLRIISPAVIARLRTPTQKAVWEVVRDNPDLLTLSGSREGGLKIGIEGRELAQLVAPRIGQEYNGKSMDVVMSKVFREAVLPAMFSAIKSDESAAQLIKSREILQVIREEVNRRPKNQGGGAFLQPAPSSGLVPKRDPADKLPSWARFASQDRGVLVRLAQTLPKGSVERKNILNLIQKSS